MTLTKRKPLTTSRAAQMERLAKESDRLFVIDYVDLGSVFQIWADATQP